MSTKYKTSRDVPTEAVIARLKELSDAVTGGRESQEREYTMRIPAECDRDADLVIAEAARRLERAQARVAELENVAKLVRDYPGVVEYVGTIVFDSLCSAIESSGKVTTSSFILRKQAEAVEAAVYGSMHTCEIKWADNLGDQVITTASLMDYAQRLRQQAADPEAKTAGGNS